MRQFIIVHSRMIERQDFLRGDLLLWNGAEWSNRAWSVIVSDSVRYSLVALVGDWFLIFLLDLALGRSMDYALYLGLLIAHVVLYGLLPLIGMHRRLIQVNRGLGVPGLYSRGIEVFLDIKQGYIRTASVFIPYDEIERIKLGHVLLTMNVNILSKGKRHWIWVSKRFLGEEGLAALLDRTGREPLPVQPQGHITSA